MMSLFIQVGNGLEHVLDGMAWVDVGGCVHRNFSASPIPAEIIDFYLTVWIIFSTEIDRFYQFQFGIGLNLLEVFVELKAAYFLAVDF